ncbi:hypothetical protein GCM10009810_16620 [Nostocoides vanveenii]|uniref:Uncharacterized protein n=1 Tax=Nostocoides vanveenii TaxID=330835 RepID=A0ABN2KJE6_9MICO
MSTSPIGSAGRPGVVTARVRAPGAPTSATVPHAWHSPHRPTHLGPLQPHSLHRKVMLRTVFAMPETLNETTDNPSARRAVSTQHR